MMAHPRETLLDELQDPDERDIAERMLFWESLLSQYGLDKAGRTIIQRTLSKHGELTKTQILMYTQAGAPPIPQAAVDALYKRILASKRD